MNLKLIRAVWLCLFTLSGLAVNAQVYINEVDADQPDTDTLEFVELFGPAGQSLDDLTLVFFNGNGDTSYRVIDLDGHSLDAGGFFLICGTQSPSLGCDLELGDSFQIQNGVDAIALYSGDFAGGAATTTNLVDVLVYDTGAGTDAGLLTALGQTLTIDEESNGDGAAHSMSRVPDGGIQLDPSNFTAQYPTPGSSNRPVINEVDADTPGTDVAEFVELFGPANFSLDGYVLVSFNGSDDASYAAFTVDLDGHSLNANGFFVVCSDSANVPNCDLSLDGSNLLQNGADAVALFLDDAVNFPEDTAVTATNLVDALVYDTNDSDDSGLLDVLTPGQPQLNEDELGDKDNHSNSRLPDGGGALITSTYTQQASTPGASNSAPPVSVPDIFVNEFVFNHSGEDSFEFVELFGTVSTDFSNLTLITIEGEQADGPGVITSVIAVGSTNASGYWWTGFKTDEYGNGAQTLLLVDGFSGSLEDDLDTDNDGTLDTTPWTEIIDGLAIDDGTTDARVYADLVLSSTIDGGAFPPGGASRFPNGTYTGQISDWDRNNFSGAGFPGVFATPDAGETANTPNAENSDTALGPLVINEFVADHTGSDTAEFIEVYGQGNTDYSAFTILQIEGEGSAEPGTIVSAQNVGTTSSFGYWETGAMVDRLQNDAVTFLLVNNFSGSVSDDLDTNNDGTLDVMPFSIIYDSVAILPGTGVEYVYSSTVLTNNFDGTDTQVGGASRIPNGTDTDTVADWTRNDFDGAGLDGFPGSLIEGEAVNTPGTLNSTSQPGGTDAIINEFVIGHTGADDHEFVEVFGSASTNYSNLAVVGIDGDTAGNPGEIIHVFQVGETNAEGYWTTGFLNSEFADNDTITLVLVSEFSGTLGQDLDTNDDGTLDTTPWSSLLDDIAVSDEDAGDTTYSASVLVELYDGLTFIPAGASRIPNGTDTDSLSDWMRNDFSGAGFDGFEGSLVEGEALNTPGAENSDRLPPGAGALISEFLIDINGDDTVEYVEIFGEADTNYDTTSILVVDSNGISEGRGAADPGIILKVITAGRTNGMGFWVSEFMTDMLPNSSLTFLVVEDFIGLEGDDLDTNDDGSIDVTPWTTLSDSVGVTDGDPIDVFYSSTVLSGNNLRGATISVGGASRFPYGQDTDSSGDWIQNDFDGAGLDGFAGSLEPGEARNTPGMVNTITTVDYYQNVDESSGTNMRNSLHILIDDHIKFPYTSDLTDTWDIINLADQDPNNAANVITIYKNASYTKISGGVGAYNREHSWPKSYGFPDDTEDAYPYTDFHHLRASDADYNSSRSNLPYGDCDAGCEEKVTDENNGEGGGSGVYPGNSNWREGSGSTGTWEVWRHRRGDIARSLLYMDVRYEGGMHNFTGFSEPDLVLTDDINLINTSGTNTTGTAYMGRLATLLAWHQEDPVDADEMARNEVVYTWQGNRNPFVDNPTWVQCVFQGVCQDQCFFDSLNDWQTANQDCNNDGLFTVLDIVAQLNGTCACQ